MSVQESKSPAPTRVDRGWLMRNRGALADDAAERIGTPIHKRRFPRPRPLQFRRPTRLVRAPAI